MGTEHVRHLELRPDAQGRGPLHQGLGLLESQRGPGRRRAIVPLVRGGKQGQGLLREQLQRAPRRTNLALGNVRIRGRRDQAGMSKQELNFANVCAVLQQMGREELL